MFYQLIVKFQKKKKKGERKVVNMNKIDDLVTVLKKRED